MNTIFISETDCPSNRERMDAWYRKALPMLTRTPTAWIRLRARGDAIKRQWRACWEQRDRLTSSNITHFPSRKTP